MSLEAVWDLRIRIGAGGAVVASSSTSDQETTALLPYSPRSACVFAAPPPPPSSTAATDPASSNKNNNNNNTNPFDDVAATTSTTSTPNNNSAVGSSIPPTPRAVVFGSEQGSLHYRTYPSPLFTDIGETDGSGSGSGSSSFGNISGSPNNRNNNNNNKSNNKSNNNNNNVNLPRPALGVTPSGRPPVNMPRAYFPVDLPPKSLPGPVMDVIPAAINNRGGSSSSGRDKGRRPPSSSSSSSQQQSQAQSPIFLVLVDDHKGSNKQGGAYAAILVTLQNGAFTKLNTTNPTTTTTTTNSNNNNNNIQSLSCHPRFKLPLRISCATYHEKCGGFVVCGGKRIITVPISQYIMTMDGTGENNNSKKGNSSSNALSRMVGGGGNKQRQQQQQQRRQQIPQNTTTIIDFSSTSLPPPGARGGQDSLIVTSNGHVAVVTVGNSIYAVPGMEVDIASSSSSGTNNNDTNNNNSAISTSSANANGTSTSSAGMTSFTSDAPAYIKVYSFGQSSQIHPVILVDVNDKSIDNEEWSTLLVCNGRECAVVDLHYDSRHHSASVSPPRNGAVNTLSPILAASSSWPFILLLTSDGLISVRSTSCLAIPLKTIEVGTRPNDFFTLRSFRGGNNNNSDMRRQRQIQQQQQQQQYALDPYNSNNNNNNRSNVHNFDDDYDEGLPWMLCMSYSGQAKVLRCKADTAQDLADRLMRISIDAFGGNGFPRNQLAEALNASFTATSYAGPEPTSHSRNLLRQYLEAVLGLAEFESGASSRWPTTIGTTSGASTNKASLSNPFSGNNTGRYSPISGTFRNAFDDDATNNNNNNNKFMVDSSPIVTEDTPNALLTGTALLCLVCTQLSPSPKGSLANRAARACSLKMGVIVIDSMNNSGMSNASIAVNEIVAERMLKEASNRSMSLLNNTSSSTAGMVASSGKRNTGYAQASMHMEFVEAATWLLRSCGRHERAIDVLYERLQQHRAPESAKQPVGFWSQIKYESYTAAHLSELWSTQKEIACQLVLDSPATVRLLEHNPELGLSVFTVNHPQNSSQWRQTADHDDPLAANPKYAPRVVQLLKSIKPVIAYPSSQNDSSDRDEIVEDVETTGLLPLESGRALAVTYLESAIGISTNRPEEDEFDLLDKSFEYSEERLSDFHDEVCFLLLEGVISERGDQDSSTNNPQGDNTSRSGGEDGDTTVLGRIYRQKLRRFLRWPLAKIRSEQLLDSLPRSFLQEQALVLGRLGRHEEALKILYCNCKSMNLALEYCDMLHKRRVIQIEKERARLAADSMLDDRANDELDEKFQKENAYLPLVRVALESDPDKKRGIASAIQILAMRRGDIDQSAALKLLPNNLPVSAVARPFLIPALVDSESQARRLKVVSSLLRAKHTALKHQLTEAQLKAQANLYVVQQFKSMNLGEPLHSNKPFKARPSSSASSTFPDVIIVKHFFPRHVVIQAKVSNNSFAVDDRALGNVSFVVAESSEDAIQPSMQIPIKILPYKTTGSAWCVLVASPNRMEGTAILTCELRYTVLGVDTASGTPLNFGQGATTGRTFVEELQDVEVFASHFS
ncbi:hypothetical protein FRACYDRAFT_241057 [Fragilariopsis cylindrus CCMP1102]|uniref:Coatomer gamma subunit appendage Ig-like subdomain domain-containing protein n=1 Tax=Fragilariopsis cylindrus CCMP1102 TaxID=635003 RepID=A0A1E7F8K6_9STRA|nr:hypothetical protein FRACYDRAFT_241057 [Fragilariopsis cylindrus CCMP1102]|eukprot:OEU14510.1 hypothetical protein FRACYDRAFT_241057 [Fragilariopsis cylindrus CCMP1102]